MLASFVSIAEGLGNDISHEVSAFRCVTTGRLGSSFGSDIVSVGAGVDVGLAGQLKDDSGRAEQCRK